MGSLSLEKQRSENENAALNKLRIAYWNYILGASRMGCKLNWGQLMKSLSRMFEEMSLTVS